MTKNVYLLIKGRFLKEQYNGCYILNEMFRKDKSVSEQIWKEVVKHWRSLYKESRENIPPDKLIFVKELSGGRIIEYYGIPPVTYFKFYGDPDTNYRLASYNLQNQIFKKGVSNENN